MNLNHATLEPMLLTKDGVRNGDKMKLKDEVCGHSRYYPQSPLTLRGIFSSSDGG